MRAEWSALAVALGMAFFLLKSRWNYGRLPKLPLSAGAEAGRVSVIIPARNEAANIERVVSSFPESRVIVVDDDSRDATAELAQRAGAEVVNAPPLRPGFLGKPNACIAGAREADSDWLLFVDADTRYEPGFAASLVAYAQSEDLQMASVFLRQERVTLFEQMLLPYAFALYFCGVSARAVNDPRSPEALANGQCLCFERRAYDFMGGHGAVANSVIEDVALARLAKRHRVRARVLRAEKLGSVRMYDGFGPLWRGFQKNSFRFLVVNPLSGAQVVLASILLTSYAPVLVWLLLERQWAAAAAFALVPWLLLWPWYGSAAVLLAPVAIYVFQLVVLNAMATTVMGRKAVWKGRRV